MGKILTDSEIVSRVNDFLHGIVNGSITVKPVSETWDYVYAGNVEFLASTGDKITFFNDCDSLDYIDNIAFLNGPTLNFEYIFERSPELTLSFEEWDSLEAILKKSGLEDECSHAGLA